MVQLTPDPVIGPTLMKELDGGRGWMRKVSRPGVFRLAAAASTAPPATAIAAGAPSVTRVLGDIETLLRGPQICLPAPATKHCCQASFFERQQTFLC
jgi:hypothetical protein